MVLDKDEFILARRNRPLDLIDCSDDLRFVEASDCGRERESEGRVNSAPPKKVAAVAPVPLLCDEVQLRVARL